MSGFDTRVEGSPESVTAAAVWLRGTLKDALGSAGEDLVSARSHAMSGFHGLAGQAYVEYDKTILTHVDDHAETVAEAAIVFDFYAARLRQYQDLMEALRGAAVAGGLTVSGTVVHAPADAVAVPPLFGPVTPAQQASYDRGVAAYQDAAAKVALYNQLLADAEAATVSFVEWVDANVTAAVATFDSPEVEKLLGVIGDNAGTFGVGFSTEYGKRRLEALSQGRGDEAADLRRSRRSGNPARRALGEAPETPGRIRDLLRESKWLGHGGRALGPAGFAFDAYQGLESDDPGGGLLAAGVGVGVTALVVATAPVSVPTAAAVAGGVALGIGAAWLTTELWDASPDGFTEPVDDIVGDAWDGTKGLASDGWGEVKSWL